MKKGIIVTILLIGLLVVSQLDVFKAKSILEVYGLENQSVEDVVQQLESGSIDSTGLTAFINSQELNLQTKKDLVTLKLPESKFYLSFAPYITSSHVCQTHYLTSCQGEMRKETFQIKVVLEDGTVYVEKEVVSENNGFVGLWLPKDIKGVLHINYEDMHVSSPISTFAEDPTCLTTPLQLVKNETHTE